MMQRAGYEVIAYGGEASEVSVTEYVPIVTKSEQRDWWPNLTRETVFNDFDPAGEGWQVFNKRAVLAIQERAEPQDIICYTMGTSQKQVADELAGLPLLHVETGIGYSGVWAPHRIFESHAWRHYLAAREKTDDVRFYDAVIPRAFDPQEYPAGDGDGGYYLFVGRLTERKGPHVAAEACARIGAKLIVAGQGDYPLPPEVEKVGVVDSWTRAELMGGAIAVFCPSLYLEPFCGVSVEAQLCGTPVIASNWGGLVENVAKGAGYLCDTLADFVKAATRAPKLDRSLIAARARKRWSTQVLAPRFERYFERLETLFGDGWYA